MKKSMSIDRQVEFHCRNMEFLGSKLKPDQVERLRQVLLARTAKAPADRTTQNANRRKEPA